MTGTGIELRVTMVINRCAGGFGLSTQAAHALAARKGLRLVHPVPGEEFLVVEGGQRRIEDSVSRDDADLVAVVREMGAAANGHSADLRVVEVPVHLDVESVDGLEEVNVWGGGFSA